MRGLIDKKILATLAIAVVFLLIGIFIKLNTPRENLVKEAIHKQRTILLDRYELLDKNSNTIWLNDTITGCYVWVSYDTLDLFYQNVQDNLRYYPRLLMNETVDGKPTAILTDDNTTIRYQIFYPSLNKSIVWQCDISIGVDRLKQVVNEENPRLIQLLG